MRPFLYSIALSFLIFSCQTESPPPNPRVNPDFEYAAYEQQAGDEVVSRAVYFDKLQGFWLAQCIANWTGLVTEMDKIGNIGEVKTGDFYTREDWGKADQPSIWAEEPSAISPTIDFVLIKKDSIWGADDDTDIEYIYQHLLYTNKTSMLSGEQIRDGWLKHIMAEEENYLWVSNQAAFDLMKQGIAPPATSDPEQNPHFEMIDAQLTTEIFGLFSPTRPDIALQMAELPVQTTARYNAQWISEFYIIMHALAIQAKDSTSLKTKLVEWRMKLVCIFLIQVMRL
jgi:hypothetical protein